jgi:hypothetical protein
VGQSDLQTFNKFGTSYLCQGYQTTRTDLEDTCLRALYLEKWAVIHKLCKFEFVPASQHVLMLASNLWIFSSPNTLSTSVKCYIVFASLNLKTLTMIGVPEGFMMTLKKHVIHREPTFLTQILRLSITNELGKQLKCSSSTMPLLSTTQ